MVTPKTVSHRRTSRRNAAFLVAGALPVAVAIAAAPAFATPPGGPSVVGAEQFRVTPVDDPVPAPDDVPPPQAPVDTIRIGDIEVGRPDFIAPEQARQINEGSEGVESSLSDALDSAGVDPARSDRIAEDVIGASVIGASVGATVASPLAATSAVMGAATGLIVGFPFLPAGLVVMPIVCAAIGYAVIAVPAAAIGGGIGAAVGAIEGAVAPLPATPQLVAPANAV
ncbi:hypothetical protein [Nocardia sp. NPDC005366]|uniref:hypothetical protein n=1 Tax=Nocardia sp. NPDC005366 TaxID=3156878 RepID=UPI0033B16486